MAESTWHEMVIYLSQRFSFMLSFFFVFCYFLFCFFVVVLHIFISFKYDFHVDNERTFA